MKYSVEKVTDEFDVMILEMDEFKQLNDMFINAVKSKYPYARLEDISRCILTDGYHRAEFLVKRK
jgi:hypothetical protein